MAGSLKDQDDEITDINITPLVDVMLVLLIIFMVTSSYIVQKTIPVELPTAKTGAVSPKKVLNFSIDRTEKLYLNNKPISVESIALEIQSFKTSNPEADLSALISADKSVSHGVVVTVMDAIRGEGVSQFALDIQDRSKL